MTMESIARTIRANYRAAATLLERVQIAPFSISEEVGKVLSSRPVLVQTGYARLSQTVGVGAPEGARVSLRHIAAGGPASVFSVVAEDVAWLTFEGFLAVPPDADSLVLEIDLRAVPPREIIADTFLRVTDTAGGVTDRGHKVLKLGAPDLVVGVYELDEDLSAAAEVRFIILLREPSGRFEIHKCDLVLV